MGNPFDSLANVAHGVIASTMGESATWRKANGNTVTGKVLFKDPTAKVTITDQEYAQVSPKIEYRDGDFPGLFESARNGERPEVTIGTYKYYGMNGKTSFDGKTITIELTDGILI
jgi:hypothetical protein